MGWHEIQITTNHATQLEDTLVAFGAQAITLRDAGNQPIYEPPLDFTPSWKDTFLVALFDDQTDLTSVTIYLQQQMKQGFVSHYQIEHLQDEDWERRCLNDLEPLKFGNRLWICPSWKKPVEADAINIILDPGLAFGTGTHETTALCLEWLDENIKGHESIIDYGCGSGILGLAALKLGSENVIAIDHDQRALDVTRSNAELNHISEAQLKTFLPATHLQFSVDLVIANILAQPLIDLASLFASFVKPQGKILLSGILAKQADDVSEMYSQWFVMEKATHKNEWVRLVGVRR